jgi:hypothetical protein
MDHQARPTPFTVIAFTASFGALGLSLCLALSYFLIGISRLGYIGSGALLIGLAILYWSLDRAEDELKVA